MRDIEAIVETFHNGGDRLLAWRGRLIWKNPLDLFIYAEIVHEVRPSLVIETGTHEGGSALFWRDMMLLCGIEGEVFSSDIERLRNRPKGSEFTFVTGSSLSPRVIRRAADKAEEHDVVLVNLDSAHNYSHVSDELLWYSPLVSVGSYLIVEDGIDDERLGRPGPLAATRRFLETHEEFVPDHHRERLGITNCPEGFLRRVARA